MSPSFVSVRSSFLALETLARRTSTSGLTSTGSIWPPVSPGGIRTVVFSVPASVLLLDGTRSLGDLDLGGPWFLGAFLAPSHSIIVWGCYSFWETFFSKLLPLDTMFLDGKRISLRACNAFGRLNSGISLYVRITSGLSYRERAR